MSPFEIHFHGVRGSLASPSRNNLAVGGNTSCVEVRAGDTRIVLDAGTGLRGVGDRLIRSGPTETTILLSHVHWDHIQGLPFFVPIYAPGNRVHVVSGPNGVMPLDQALRHQMSPPFFPVSVDDVSGQLSAAEHRPGASFQVGNVTVRMERLNHPDPVYGYRLEVDDHALVYATDTEHYSCVDPTLCALADGADVLIYDAQYTPEEYRGDDGPSKVGWGHSTFQAGAQLARAANVGKLVLFHHDPRRTDAAVAAVESRARRMFADTVAAREGMVLDARGGAQEADAA